MNFTYSPNNTLISNILSVGYGNIFAFGYLSDNSNPISFTNFRFCLINLPKKTSKSYNNINITYLHGVGDKSNIAIDTRNIAIDTKNIDNDTRNIAIDTKNIDNDKTNIAIDTKNIDNDTRNIAIDTKNIDNDKTNIAIDTKNIDNDTKNIDYATRKIAIVTKFFGSNTKVFNIASTSLTSVSARFKRVLSNFCFLFFSILYHSKTLLTFGASKKL